MMLPIVGAAGSPVYASGYIIALLFWGIRGVIVSFRRYRVIRTGISALSIKNAVDSMHTGVLLGYPDGYVLLINERMQRLMVEITGKVQRNGRLFFNTLSSREQLRSCSEVSCAKLPQDFCRQVAWQSRRNASAFQGFDTPHGGKKTRQDVQVTSEQLLRPGCQTTEYEGQVVCLLPDETAWMFIETELTIRKKRYIQITATDITQRWALTAELQQKEEQLKLRGKEIRRTLETLQVLSRNTEIQKAKLRAHDLLGQRLSLLLRVLRGEGVPDYEMIRTQSQMLPDDLLREQNESSPRDRIDSLRQTFETIGVDIQFDGELPEDEIIGHVFADIINEGVSNAVRHGFATKVFVLINHSDGHYHMSITDDGFPPAEPVTEGGGISGMRNSLKRHGGTLNVVAAPRFTLKVVI
jgi:hypothetical protein